MVESGDDRHVGRGRGRDRRGLRRVHFFVGGKEGPKISNPFLLLPPSLSLSLSLPLSLSTPLGFLLPTLFALSLWWKISPQSSHAIACFHCLLRTLKLFTAPQRVGPEFRESCPPHGALLKPRQCAFYLGSNRD